MDYGWDDEWFFGAVSMNAWILKILRGLGVDWRSQTGSRSD